jgi:hypothetical protein
VRSIIREVDSVSDNADSFMQTVCKISFVSLTPLTAKKADFIVKYLGEFEFKSGAQMVLFDKKSLVENLVTGFL